jgi:ABC-type dipeptide/oligopeptide/nickel transport system permease component
MVGLMFVGLITGTTIIEIVFAIPGMGRLLVTAVVDRDYPIVQSMLMITAVLFVYVNLLVDIIYAYVDPRIRY